MISNGPLNGVMVYGPDLFPTLSKAVKVKLGKAFWYKCLSQDFKIPGPPGKEERMAKNIYVGNLNYNTGEDTLADVFAEYGNVLKVRIITDRETQRSKGFGFVEMEDDEAGEAAIAALNNAEVDGRNLKVNEAQERKPRNNFNSY